MEDHIYKNHVRPDEVPFYCRLCLFKCTKWEQLLNHMTNYAPHVDLVKKRGYTDQGQSFLTKSNSPYQLGPVDYIRLESEDSIRHWLKVIRGDKNVTQDVSSPDVTALLGHMWLWTGRRRSMEIRWTPNAPRRASCSCPLGGK